MEQKGQKTSAMGSEVLLMSNRFIQEYPKLSSYFGHVVRASRKSTSGSIVKIMKSDSFRSDCNLNGMHFVFVSGCSPDKEILKLSTYVNRSSDTSIAQSSRKTMPTVIFLNFHVAFKVVQSSGIRDSCKCLFGGSTEEEIYRTIADCAKIHSKEKRLQVKAYVKQHMRDLLVGNDMYVASRLWLQHAFFTALNISENDTKLILDSCKSLKQLCYISRTNPDYLLERIPVHVNNLNLVWRLLFHKEFFQYELNLQECV